MKRKTLHALFLLSFSCFFIIPSIAQTPVKEWDKTFGGIGSEGHNFLSGFTVIQQIRDGDHGFIMGGYSNSDVSGDKTEKSRGKEDFWIVKIDPKGNKKWDRTFGGSGSDGVSALQQTKDGGYILGGYSTSGIGYDKTEASRGNYDYWIVKVDKRGRKQWDKTYGGSANDFLSCIQQTKDGGYILGGHSISGISGDKTDSNRFQYNEYDDYWIVKVDSNGTKQWDKTYGGVLSDQCFAVQQTKDGGYIVGGSSSSWQAGDKTAPNKGRSDYWILKLTSTGDKEWDKTYGGSDEDNFRSLDKTRDGGYILGGYSKSHISGDKTQGSRGDYDYWIVKIDAEGNKKWDKRYGGRSFDYLTFLEQTSDDGYILGGNSSSDSSKDKTEASKGAYDYWIVKLYRNGNKEWDKTIGGSNFDYYVSVRETTDGGYILGGESYSDSTGDKTQNSFGSSDYWVVKLGNPTASSVIKVNQAQQNKIPEPVTSTLYPNPTNGKFTLVLNTVKATKANIEITNASGVIVEKRTVQITGKQQPLNFNLTNKPIGSYFVKIISEDGIQTTKVVIQK